MDSSCCSDDEEHQFFDAPEDIDAITDSELNRLERESSHSGAGGIGDWNSSKFDVWLQNPESVQERRSKFFNWLGLDVNKMSCEEEDSVDNLDFDGDVDRITGTTGALLGSSSFECRFSSSRSFCSFSDESEFFEDSVSKENISCRVRDFGEGSECIVDKLVGEAQLGGIQQVCQPDSSVVAARSHSPNREAFPVNCEDDEHDMIVPKVGIKKWWLKKLRSFTCVLEGQEENENSNSIHSGAAKVHRVKVRQNKKRCKELSALYLGQDIHAHKGSILTMKFSPDGQYIASAGEDGIVRVWKVVEDARSDELDVPNIDPSCVYFTMNHLSELKPVVSEKEKVVRSSALKKTSESACVIVPPKVFRILEAPVNEFKGHTGQVLDLSWSKNNHLLSSSVDKTARLWKVGCDSCIKVFSHSNYVTCIQFNPVDDNYFISGSIDGKVRIWGVYDCQVVSWIDIKDIVTAVCYRPDGQGGIIGSVNGYCRFYGISDNHLELNAQICLNGKKKSSGKRITGLQGSMQYLPQDPCKVMVSCAGSHVRILNGTNVIGKYKGLRGAGNYSSASMTADGKHIVSACEDSNVYVWNFNRKHNQNSSQLKKVQSFERFPSNASVAIPWCGLQSGNIERAPCSYPFSSPTSFPYNQEFFLESIPKGSATATWPEEKLPASDHQGNPAKMHKSVFKFLKSSCLSTSCTHAWGMVIVTAGFDGRIRSFHNYGLPAPC